MPSPYAGLPAEQLEERFRQGDAQAADELVCRHEPRLRGLALRYAGHDAEVAADGFVGFFSRVRDATGRGKWDPGKGPWLAWATTVLRNAVTDELRGHARRRERERPGGEDSAGDAAPGGLGAELAAAVWEIIRPLVEPHQPPPAAPPPGLGEGSPPLPREAQEFLAAFRRALRDCLGQLKPEQQGLLVAGLWGGKKSHEHEGVSGPAYRQRAHRAREALGRCVSDKVPGVRYEC
jgi:RNA polymerase sigma factor (sigma-70 family)